MATTISKWAGQFPQLSSYASGMPNLVSLHKLEANGNATVGNNYTLSSGTSYNHTKYMKHGKCFTTVGYHYTAEATYPTSGDSNHDLNNATRTIKIWYKKSGSTSDGQVVYGQMTAGQSEYRWFRVQTDGTAVITLGDTGGGVIVDMYSNTNWVNIEDGLPHEIAVVKASNSDWKLYIDGILHDLTTTNLDFFTAQKIQFGANGDSIAAMTGQIDEISSFNNAQTAAQMYAYGGALMC